MIVSNSTYLSNKFYKSKFPNSNMEFLTKKRLNSYYDEFNHTITIRDLPSHLMLILESGKKISVKNYVENNLSENIIKIYFGKSPKISIKLPINLKSISNKSVFKVSDFNYKMRELGYKSPQKFIWHYSKNKQLIEKVSRGVYRII